MMSVHIAILCMDRRKWRAESYSCNRQSPIFLVKMPLSDSPLDPLLYFCFSLMQIGEDTEDHIKSAGTSLL